MEWFRFAPARLAGLAGVFYDDAHAVTAVVIGQITHHPDPGMFHFDDGGDPLRGTQPEHRTSAWVGTGLPSNPTTRKHDQAAPDYGFHRRWR